MIGEILFAVSLVILLLMTSGVVGYYTYVAYKENKRLGITISIILGAFVLGVVGIILNQLNI